MGESGGVGCSSGLIDRSRFGSLRSRLSGITTCRGDSRRFPVLGEGCFHDGPSLLVNSSCFSIKGVMRMGAGRGNRDMGLTGAGIGSSGRNDDEATGGDFCGVSLGNGGMSHGRGIRSSEDGAVIFLTGGIGILSGVGDLFHGAGITGVASLNGGDGVVDGGKSM